MYMGLLTLRTSVPLILLPTLVTLLPVGLLCPTSTEKFIIFYFDMFCCYLLEMYPFLMTEKE